MRIKLILISAVMFILFSFSLYSEEMMRIVVMNLKADGVPERTARTVTNMLRTELINIGGFTVVERAQMDAILEEQGLQQSGCTDQECAVQIGKLMSAKKIMVGEVSPMGKSIITTVRIVDVEKGISEFAANQKADSEDVLDEAVTKIARNIASRISGKSPTSRVAKKEKEPVAESSGGGKSLGAYYALGFIPGLGQLLLLLVLGGMHLGILHRLVDLLLGIPRKPYKIDKYRKPHHQAKDRSDSFPLR